MKFVNAIRKVARPLGLLNADGSLKKIDSLDMINLIVAVEELTGVSVPAASLREEAFESVESLSALLEQFAEK